MDQIPTSDDPGFPYSHLVHNFHRDDLRTMVEIAADVNNEVRNVHTLIPDGRYDQPDEVWQPIMEERIRASSSVELLTIKSGYIDEAGAVVITDEGDPGPGTRWELEQARKYGKPITEQFMIRLEGGGYLIPEGQAKSPMFDYATGLRAFRNRSIRWATDHLRDDDARPHDEFAGSQPADERDTEFADADVALKRFLEMIKSEPASGEQQRNLAELYLRLGFIAQERTRAAEAIEWYSKAAALFEQLADPANTAAAFQLVGDVAYHNYEFDVATRTYQRALAIFEHLGERENAAATFHQLGNVAFMDGHTEDAGNWYQRARLILEELQREGDLKHAAGLASTYQQIGIVAHRRQLLDEAKSWYEKSLELRRSVGYSLGIAASYHQLGIIEMDIGNVAAANEFFTQAYELFDETGSMSSIEYIRQRAVVCHQLGNAAYLLNRPDDAEDWYARAVRDFSKAGDRYQMAISLCALSRVTEEQGYPRDSLEWAVRAAYFCDQARREDLGGCLTQLRHLAEELGLAALDECWREVAGEVLPSDLKTQVAAPDLAP
jgi:tetratricopeptide (TPR) repeat protein